LKHIRAFTLIELLVVIAIIAILAAILFPVFAQAKFAAKKTVDLSNAKEIGTANYLYLNDYDDTMPIFYAYNSDPTIYAPPVHHGTEVLLLTYMKNKTIFGSPLDTGGPYLAEDPGSMAQGATTYFQAYGTSYRFDHCNFSTVANESSENNSFYLATSIVTDTQIQFPAETRVIRLEMMGFFANTSGTQCTKYGYDCPPPYNYFKNWDPSGGTLIYSDSHAKHASTSIAFDQSRVDPAGDMSGAPTGNPNTPTWYWQCD
jgi:prepilin-type N-terminal cleavage/methylation domain-containing protein